ncbi:unnamed protein product [Rotaria sp. Silwood2]|nr:unnamed protein product [Rotaria sp. Silwood2]CAF4150145.1 unnamed protein product [Rotaria sp. Silwood2]
MHLKYRQDLGIKSQIRQWLIYHSVPFLDQYSKSELLELSYASAPEKKYIVDETAKQFDIEILRLPVRHCILNAIEGC